MASEKSHKKAVPATQFSVLTQRDSSQITLVIRTKENFPSTAAESDKNHQEAAMPLFFRFIYHPQGIELLWCLYVFSFRK